MKLVSIAQTRPTYWQKTSATFDMLKGKIELKKYSHEEYNSMAMAQQQQLYEHWHKAGLLKGKKIAESNKASEVRVAIL